MTVEYCKQGVSSSDIEFTNGCILHVSSPPCMSIKVTLHFAKGKLKFLFQVLAFIGFFLSLWLS